MKRNPNPVPPELQDEADALASMPEEQIDASDMPKVQDWSHAKRGLFFRPVKKQITLRLDADLIEWFKENHLPKEGYQTSINRALREYIGQHVNR